MSVRPASPATADGMGLRDVMRHFATGVTVLTTGGEHAHGMTANAFTSVSLDPPLVACCVANTAYMHEAISRQGAFAVSILGADQEHLAHYFTDRSRPRGPAQFAGLSHRRGTWVDAPLLAGAAAWLECRLASTHNGGDHTIFIGEVLSTAWTKTPSALLFHGGDYHNLDPG